MKFGVIADVQYADADAKDQTPERLYRLAAQKLRSALEFLNTQDVEFVVHLGDLIDRYEKSYDELAPILSVSRHKLIHVLGNHDFIAEGGRKKISSATVLERLGLKAKYYSFMSGQWKFIVLDTNEVGLIEQDDTERFAEGKRLLTKAKELHLPNAHPSNGTISEQQRTWLIAELQNAQKDGTSVILFGHHPVAPLMQTTALDPERVTGLFAQFPCIQAYMCGHHHDGEYDEVSGVPCITYKALLDTKETSYAVVDLHEGSLEIHGYGREESKKVSLKG